MELRRISSTTKISASASGRVLCSSIFGIGSELQIMQAWHHVFLSFFTNLCNRSNDDLKWTVFNIQAARSSSLTLQP